MLIVKAVVLQEHGLQKLDLLQVVNVKVDALLVDFLLKLVSPTTNSAKEDALLENIQKSLDALLMISVLDVLLVNIQQRLDSLLILSVMGDALQEDFHRRLV